MCLRKSPSGLVSVINVDYDEIVEALRSRWVKNNRGFFCEPFWRLIAMLTFSEYDTGVYAFNLVELVVKDKSMLDVLKGWRRGGCHWRNGGMAGNTGVF